MNILHRYIMKTILASAGVVVLVVAGLIFFITLLGEFRDLGVGDYGFWQVVTHVLLTMPHILYDFFPMLVLISGMIGLGMLAANQELTVMRASGVSMLKVALAVVTAAVVLIFVSTVLGELIAPQAHYLANKRKVTAVNNGQAVSTASGVWIHEGNNFLHVDRVVGLNHLEGVTRYQFDASHHLLAAYFAKSLDFENGQWTIHNLLRTVFVSDQTMSQFQPEATWDLKLNPSLLNVGLIEPEEMSLRNLKNYSEHLVENRLEASPFQFEFWKRIFQPLTTLVMILLAIPFVFNSERSVTMGWRVLFGILIGFAFYILNAFLGQFSIVFQVSPFLAAIIPTLLVASIGYVLALKLRR